MIFISFKFVRFVKLNNYVKVKRVQKHIETLDTLKMPRPNSVPLKNEHNMLRESKVKSGVQKQHLQERQMNTTVEQTPKKQQPLKHSDSVVVTTKWETFD